MIERQNPVRKIGGILLEPAVRFLVSHGVDPNSISETGGKMSMIGGVVLMNQGRIAELAKYCLKIDETKARRIVRAAGGAFWVAGIICDGLDGAVAKRTNQQTLYGQWLDSVIDRRVDLMPWPFQKINSQHPIDTAIAEVNSVANSVPALLKCAKPDVPELEIGSRFPRLLTLTGFLLFPSLRRYTGILLAAQSIATAYTRYQNIENEGTKAVKRRAFFLLRRHLRAYVDSKLRPEGFVCGFSTTAAMVNEFSQAKAEEIGLKLAA